MTGKDAFIIEPSKDKHISISQGGVTIRHMGKPIKSTTTGAGGYVYLLVDCSGSMAGDKIRQARRGALAFAKDALASGYSVGLIGFDSSATHLCELTRTIQLLDQCLEHLEVGDQTHMAQAINLSYEKLSGKEGSKAIVIVTDGMPNGYGDPETTIRAGEIAKKAGVDIIIIGTDDADQDFLKKLASRSELGMKVIRQQLEQAITSSARLLPGGDRPQLTE